MAFLLLTIASPIAADLAAPAAALTAQSLSLTPEAAGDFAAWAGLLLGVWLLGGLARSGRPRRATASARIVGRGPRLR